MSPEAIPERFEAWPLHDAVLRRIEHDWEGACVSMELRVFLHPGENAMPCRIVWRDVTRLVVPSTAPWGRSDLVNRAGRDGLRYWLEMQSGDTIEVEAADVVLRADV